MEWYYARDGEAIGPLSEQDIRRLIESGDLRSHDLVWHPGRTTWSEATDLLDAFSPPPLGQHRVTTKTAPPPIPAQASSPEATSSPQHPAVKKANYFLRHWRGDLSLGVTYWVNGFLGNFILYAVVFALVGYLNASESNYNVAVFWILLYLSCALVVTWQAVGVWRSATHHVQSSGKRFWAAVAKVMVVIGIINFADDFAKNGLPAISEALKQGAWLTSEAKWEINLLRNGTEVEISGGVGHGLADDFQKILNADPSIELVHVNLSLGGLVGEAVKVEDLIRSRGLATYTSARCVSACTIIFLGGRERYLRSGARLGFHSYRIPGISQENMDFSAEKQRLADAGVSRDFIDKVFRVSPNDMWFPTDTELKQAGVVDAVVSGDDFGLSGFKRGAVMEQLRNELANTRIYRVIQARDPVTYNEIVGRLEKGIQSGASLDDLRPQIVGSVETMLDRYLPYASDEAVLGFARIVVAEVDSLASQDSKVCYAYIMERDASALNAAVKALPVQLRQRELDVIADVIESADTSRPAPNKASMNKLMMRLIQNAARKMGKDAWALGKLNDPTLDPALGCQAASAIYKSALELPPSEGGSVLRYMFTNAS